MQDQTINTTNILGHLASPRTKNLFVYNKESRMLQSFPKESYNKNLISKMLHQNVSHAIVYYSIINQARS